MEQIMYCDECNKERKIEVRKETVLCPVRGEETEIIASITYCTHCSSQVWNEELEEENFKTAFNKYRENHNLLQPEEIKRIRDKYEISQTLFAKILGLGEKTITRYENGSIQDVAQNNLIALSNYPDNFEKLLIMAKDRLSEPDYTKVMEGLSQYRPRVVSVNADSISYQTKKPYIFDDCNKQKRFWGGALSAG